MNCPRCHKTREESPGEALGGYCWACNAELWHASLGAHNEAEDRREARVLRLRQGRSIRDRSLAKRQAQLRTSAWHGTEFAPTARSLADMLLFTFYGAPMRARARVADLLDEAHRVMERAMRDRGQSSRSRDAVAAR